MSALVLRTLPSKAWPAVVRVAAVGALILLSAETGRLATEPQYFRLILAFLGGALILALGVLRPSALFVTLLIWLAALGTIRRLVSTVAVSTGSDPLLLLGPAALGLLAAIALSRGATRPRTPLSRSVIALSMIIGIETFNPRQGGLFAGASGLLFVLVPTLAFWIGRGLLNDRLFRRGLVVMLGLATPAAVYGLVQTLSGFPSWDVRWINAVESSQYVALNVGGVIRPFSSFSSAAEYGTYMALGFLVIVAFVINRPRLLMLLAPVAVLFAVAIGYESSRGVVFGLVLALGGIVAAWKRLSILGGAAIGAIFVFLLPVAVQRVAPSNVGSGTGSALLQHQLGGLSHPLSSNTTYTIHLHEVLQGLKSAVTNPAGDGVSSVTIAGAKYGGVSASTEADPSNAAVALGLPGLVAYLATAFFGLATAYRVAVKRRDAVGLAALGIVLMTFLQWLNGGEYSIAFLPWLALGWADRQNHKGADALPQRTVSRAP